MGSSQDRIADSLQRIAVALERLAPLPAVLPEVTGADAFVWQPAPPRLRPVATVARVRAELLLGIAAQKAALFDNTRRFAAGMAANNALLWGARGMGKSSLVKAAHAACPAGSVALIEILREDLASLPALLDILRAQPRRVLLFCDDLSFETMDGHYKALKSVLDGGLEGRPSNVLLYATSNRKHLMPRAMIENEEAAAINRGEAADEKVSLSDRFGLSIGFYPCDQETYLAIIDAYAEARGLEEDRPALHRRALEWAAARGARSGRVAAQFMAGT